MIIRGYKLNKKGFTLIEILSIIVILVIVFLIGRFLVMGMVEKVYIEACLANERSMSHATKNYLTLETGKRLPQNIDETIDVLLVDLIEDGYLEPVFDPKTKQLVDVINSKVLITKQGNDYNYEPILISPTCSGDDTEIVTGGELSDMVWEGWMTLTLYYPESSTERKWRLGNEGEIRNDEMLMWQNYIRPITIPLDRVEDVWISYKIGDDYFVIPPSWKITS